MCYIDYHSVSFLEIANHLDSYWWEWKRIVADLFRIVVNERCFAAVYY